MSLADLVGDVDAFADHHWGRRPLVRASGLDFADLLDVEDAEALLLTSARRPTFRLVQDGERLPPERSTTPVRMGGATLDDVADVAKIAEAVDGGATLVLQALQRTWPPLIELCRRLERELSHPVQANAYLTPAGARGLARHADEHDVLVLQSSGHKSWDVAGLGAITTAPGDVLYLPAHTDHSAEAQGEVSLHITIGILRVTYGHVMRRLLDRLDGVDLDAPLPVGFASPDRSDALHDELTRHLREVAAARGADRPRATSCSTSNAGRPVGARPFRAGSSSRSSRWTGSTRRRWWRRGPITRPSCVDADGGRVALLLIDRTVEVPATARAALEHLLRGEDTKVGELPDLSDASRTVLVRRLVREGWLRIVTCVHP